ncbi:MAG: hypothetical protein SFX73_04950 [Kofleriaceae bacterium]|nr:hypothetical protein [Kofleriaceae bacterium]
MKNLAYVACALSLALVACRGGEGDDVGGDDMQNPDSPPIGGDVTIQEIQNDAMPSGTQVELRGVVVTAIDAYGNRTGDLFVSEPEGGPNSGVKVFGAPLETLATLQVGDVVDITSAIKHEACNEAAPCGTVVFDDGASITEVMGVSAGSLVITKTGTAPLPTPVTVDAKAIAALATKAERVAEWEKYEGVLIKVINARQLSVTSPFGSNPGPDSNEFRISGVARVQSVLAELPNTATVGTCYESITGVGDFFFNNLVLPRSAADLVGGGTACNPMASSIQELQTASTPPELVNLTDVYVSAISFNKKNLWLSTSATAAANNGVYVYRGPSSSTDVLPANVVVGAKVSVLGGAEEFDGNDGGDTVTQLTSPAITVAAGSPATITPVTNQTVSTLLASGTGEPYESVLVTLTNVKVNTVGTSTNNYLTDLAQYPGATAFKADDDIYRFVTGDANACYASITGLWTYNAFEDQYMFLPLAAGTGTGNCSN